MTSPARYRKKPVEIEAEQWDGTAEGATRIIDWLLAHDATATYTCSNPDRCSETDGDTPHSIAIQTLEGTMRADLNDWIIKGVQGEFYPCKPDIFAATYDPSFAEKYSPNPVALHVVTVVAEGQEIVEEQRARLADWLEANGIDPKRVSQRGPITVETRMHEGQLIGQGLIGFQEYYLDGDGHKELNEKTVEPFTYERWVRQQVPLGPDPAWVESQAKEGRKA
ncbi:hypothetical protein [Streptomyces sp. 8L]|uniref:hypothetical protein n=1 Tax=Streptomyces sp. 8L TaxID=2877242 RepID=UPI001CD39209|nr:hypothetical protein [Streptomyces sp. 8L]MCA1220256.1 hypothetical protein [Streptomyces sp. 8L]